jgi:ketosteroid isomerase-like protein
MMLWTTSVYANNAEEIRALEMQRYQAMVQGEFALLDTMLSDDLVFTHANGQIDVKKAFMDRLKSGILEYKSIETRDVKVRFYGTCSIVTGISLLNIKVKDEDRELPLRFTTVYVKQENQWRVVAYQSTLLPRK